MMIGDLIDKLKNISMNQESLLVIAELVINNSLSLNQLKNKVSKETQDKLNSILEQLINYDLVRKNGENYSVDTNNFQMLFDAKSKYGEKANIRRESKLASLFFFKTLLDREINTLLNLSSQDYENLYVKGKEHTKYNSHSIQMINKDIFTKYQNILNPIYEEFRKEVRTYDESTKFKKTFPYLMYTGFFYIPELDKE